MDCICFSRVHIGMLYFCNIYPFFSLTTLFLWRFSTTPQGLEAREHSVERRYAYTDNRLRFCKNRWPIRRRFAFSSAGNLYKKAENKQRRFFVFLKYVYLGLERLQINHSLCLWSMLFILVKSIILFVFARFIIIIIVEVAALLEHFQIMPWL